jgi:hypothetical protein
MDADPRAQVHLGGQVVELAQASLVGKRERDRRDRAVEHHQKPIGLVDLAAAVLVHQSARETIVFAEKLGSVKIAEAFDERGGVREIAKHERAQQRDGLIVPRLDVRSLRVQDCVHGRVFRRFIEPLVAQAPLPASRICRPGDENVREAVCMASRRSDGRSGSFDHAVTVATDAFGFV